MSDSSNRSGTREGRRGRGGRRRRSGKRSEKRGESRGDIRPSGSSSSSASTKSTRRPTKKKTLWEKILAFFTGGGRDKSLPANAHGSTPKRQASSVSAPQKADASAQRTESSSEETPQRERQRVGIRKPEVVEVTSPRVYVGNLSFEATESDLFELFGGVGKVQNVEVVYDRRTLRSRGFGFVQMQTIEEAMRAVAELHDKEFMGRKLVVSGAKALEERRSERQSSDLGSENAASEAKAAADLAETAEQPEIPRAKTEQQESVDSESAERQSQQ
jgi:RNA recognition motif-containing protein